VEREVECFGDLLQPAFESLRRSVSYDIDGRPQHVVTLVSTRSLWSDEGRPDFSLLQERISQRRGAATAVQLR